jgi:hypothetical protein
MADRRPTIHQRKYSELREHHFTPGESRALSLLPRNNPARDDMIQDRDQRWERFIRIAHNKVERGKWRERDIPSKWLKNLSRLYSKKRYRVQYGPTGDQPKLPKGSPNPWAMYRDYEKRQGGPDGKPYRSPWEIKQIRAGKTELQKGIIFIQKTERKAETGAISKSQIQSWIAGKEQAIKKARGKHRAQLMIERNRLEKLL